MAHDRSFADFYGILGVDPTCDFKTLEAAYRELAKAYHPDHPEHADTEKLTAVLEAYRSLRNPEDRGRYDLKYTLNTGFSFDDAARSKEAERVAISDDDAHREILLSLYKRRRDFATDPGVGPYALQEMLHCSDEAFKFYAWYLKGKGWVELTEEGTLAITVDGVDHVISMAGEKFESERRRIAHTSNEGSFEDPPS